MCLNLFYTLSGIKLFVIIREFGIRKTYSHVDMNILVQAPGLEEDVVVIRRTFLKKIKPGHPSKQRMNFQRSSIVL